MYMHTSTYTPVLHIVPIRLYYIVLLYVWIIVCIYIYICPTARTCVHQTAACVYALHDIRLPVGRHIAHSRPIQLFIFIVGQSRKSHHVMVSLTKHVASTLHWGDRHVCIPQKGIEPQQVHERECNTDNYVHIVIANENKTILMASHIKTVLKLNTRLYACNGKPKHRPR